MLASDPFRAETKYDSKQNANFLTRCLQSKGEAIPDKFDSI
jgi:hypothetical protein